MLLFCLFSFAQVLFIFLSLPSTLPYCCFTILLHWACERGLQSVVVLSIQVPSSGCLLEGAFRNVDMTLVLERLAERSLYAFFFLSLSPSICVILSYTFLSLSLSLSLIACWCFTFSLEACPVFGVKFSDVSRAFSTLFASLLFSLSDLCHFHIFLSQFHL